MRIPGAEHAVVDVAKRYGPRLERIGVTVPLAKDTVVDLREVPRSLLFAGI